jgi:3-methylcrotonyl-CoA carboxylase beta subunit
MGPEPNKIKHKSKGKLTARSRINNLIDKNTYFLELSPLAAYEVYGDDVPAAGIITGVGVIKSHYCIIIANDATVKGGTYYPLTVKKTLEGSGDCLRKQITMHLFS